MLNLYNNNSMFFFKTLIAFLQDDEYRDLLITTIVIIIVGTVAYHYLEGWSLLDSLYFSVVTLTTIGFGDFSPKTDGGKIFTIFYIVMGIGMILSFINTVQHHFTIMRHQEKRDLVKRFKKVTDFTTGTTKKDNE